MTRHCGQWAIAAVCLLAAVSHVFAEAKDVQKLAERVGKGVVTIKTADGSGSGFIIDGRRVVSQGARCDIKSSKQDGAITHLIAGCATDVMLSNMQASFKTINKDRILRIFPSVSEMEIPFERCVLK